METILIPEIERREMYIYLVTDGKGRYYNTVLNSVSTDFQGAHLFRTEEEARSVAEVNHFIMKFFASFVRTRRVDEDQE